MVVTCQRITNSYHKEKTLTKITWCSFLPTFFCTMDRQTSMSKKWTTVISSQDISEGKSLQIQRNPGIIGTGESKRPEIPKVGTSVQQFMAVPVAPAAKPDSTSFSDESLKLEEECKHWMIPWHKTCYRKVVYV